MQSRRKFFKFIKSFFAFCFTMQYSSLKATNPRPFHHLEDGTFQNLPGSPMRVLSTNRTKSNFFRFFYKGIIKKKMFDQKEVPDNIPLSHALSQQNAIKEFNLNKEKNSITWLGHASFLIKIENKHILTDPYLTDIAGPFGIGPKRYIPSGIKIRDLPAIDTILISHNHYDHLDTKTLVKIKNKKNITIICPLKLSKLFFTLGFKKVIELDWYENHKIDKINFISVPAYHWSRRLGQKRNAFLWSGYVINYQSKKIYFSGDTAFGTMFNDIGKKLGPFDLTIISIGAYLPRDMMQASHCTPEEAVRITSMLGSSNILSMHWGTIRLSAEDPWDPPKKFYIAAKKAGYNEDQIWKLPIGGTKSLI